MDPCANVVHAEPGALRELERPNDPNSRRDPMPAKVRRAAWYDVLVYKHGFVASMLLSISVAIVAIAASVLGFVTETAPVAWGGAVLVLGCLVDIAKAVRGIRQSVGES
jgi:hypothetical protein